MTRRVDDIDFNALVIDGNILGENGDASFPLQIVVVENQLAQFLLVADQLGLINHTVHQRRLSVIDVGDNRYIPDVLHIRL